MCGCVEISLLAEAEFPEDALSPPCGHKQWDWAPNSLQSTSECYTNLTMSRCSMM